MLIVASHERLATPGQRAAWPALEVTKRQRRPTGLTRRHCASGGRVGRPDPAAGNTPQTNFAPSHHTEGRVGIIGRVSTATAAEPAQIQAPNRPNLVSVGTIVWLSQELMFFAALFAMYFTVRQVTLPDSWPPDDVHLNIPFASVNTLVLVSSSWFVITYLMGAFFVAGQVFEYTELVHEGLTLSSSPYGSVFYLTTGFHALHVTGGLIAFLFVLATTYIARRFDHDQATRAIVVSYYWHFVDVVWIALFATIYFIQ